MNPFAQPVPTTPQTVFAQFFVEPIHLTARSEVEGRPIFEDREFVKILVAGDAKSAVVREATDQDKARFSAAYAQFQREAGDSIHIEGTPLSQWPQMKASQIRELGALNVFSVEQLAALTDAGTERLGMGGRELVAKAKAFLENARNSAASAAYAAENERLKVEVTDLRDQVRLLASQVEALKSVAPASTPAPTGRRAAA